MEESDDERRRQWLGTETAQSTKPTRGSRIIETAGRRLEAGTRIDGSGVAALMTDAGLTNGAFYARFESKDDLVANAVADQLATQRAVLACATRGQGGSWGSSSVSTCSPQHRDDPGTGCPNAALLDEIGRCGDGVRDSYTQGNAIHRRRDRDTPVSRGSLRRANHRAWAVHDPRCHHAARARRFRP